MTKPCPSQHLPKSPYSIQLPPSPTQPPSPSYHFLSPQRSIHPNWSIAIHAAFPQPSFNFAINMLYFSLLVMLLIYKSDHFTIFKIRTKALSQSLLQGLKQQKCKRLLIAGFQSQRESQFSVRVKAGTNTVTEMMTKRAAPARFQALGSAIPEAERNPALAKFQGILLASL